MRAKLTFLILIVFAIFNDSFADNDAGNSYLIQVSEKAGILHNQKISDNFERLKKDFAAQYADKAKEIEQQSEYLSEKQQMRLYYKYLAEMAFVDYKEYLLNKLREKSKETGRAIKQETVNQDYKNLHKKAGCDIPTDTYYWLDRGELDSEKCKIPKKTKIKNLAEEERKHSCFYPDGYEEFNIKISETRYCPELNDDGSTVYNKVSGLFDSVENDASVVFSISLSGYGDNSGRMDGVDFDIYQDTYVYSDFYKWRNQEIQDIKDGKFVYDPKCDLPDFSQKKRKKPRGCIKMNGDASKWKSNHIPASRGTGYIFDYSISTTSFQPYDIDEED